MVVKLPGLQTYPNEVLPVALLLFNKEKRKHVALLTARMRRGMKGGTVMSWSLAQEGDSHLSEIGDPGHVTETWGGRPQLPPLGPPSEH